MKKRRHRSDSSAWMAIPLYIFTIVFVVCPLVYMVALSFATPSRGFGVTWKFTLDNYRNILEPVYLNTFVESLKLAFTSTIVIALIGYPFGYFMARLPEHRKKKAQLLLSTPFWVNSLIRLYGWIIILQKKGLLNFENTTMADVADLLSRQFGVQVQCDATIANCSFTGNLSELELKEVFKIIELTTSFVAKEENHDFFISGQGCN